MCSSCSDFREAEEKGAVTAEMRKMHEEHILHDQVQRTAFISEKERASHAPGLLLCIFDFSTSHETPSAKAHIGSWVLIYTGRDGLSHRLNLDSIALHTCNYEFVGFSSVFGKKITHGQILCS